VAGPDFRHGAGRLPIQQHGQAVGLLLVGDFVLGKAKEGLEGDEDRQNDQGGSRRL
jgi:hypothetical protein